LAHRTDWRYGICNDQPGVVIDVTEYITCLCAVGPKYYDS